jgi:hypothetical protein
MLELTQAWENAGVINTIIWLTLLEAGVLVACALCQRPLLPLADCLPNLASGLCLMLAVRSVVLGHPWYGPVVWVSLAGMVHFVDLALRLRRRGRHRPQPLAQESGS